MGNYSIQVASRNLQPQSIAGNEIRLSLSVQRRVLNLLKQQKPYEWVTGLFGKTEYTAAQNVAFDKSLLQNKIKTLDCAQEANQIAPEDAYVAFNNTEFVIMPETEGSQLNVKQAYRILEEAISSSLPSVDFAANPDAYNKAAVVSTDPELQDTVMAYNNFTKANITYTFGEQTVTLDGSTIKDWLQFDEKGRLLQDSDAFQQHIADYVAQLAADHDTVGTTRSFIQPMGVRFMCMEAPMDGRLTRQVRLRSFCRISRMACRRRESRFTKCVPMHTATMTSGSTYIEVDMGTQHMYYYQDGYIILTVRSYPDWQEIRTERHLPEYLSCIPNPVLPFFAEALTGWRV